jgi:hypothetical protein
MVIVPALELPLPLSLMSILKPMEWQEQIARARQYLIIFIFRTARKKIARG